MTEHEYAVDESGLLVPPHFDQGTTSAREGTIFGRQATTGAAGAPIGAPVAEPGTVAKASVRAAPPASPTRPGMPTRPALAAAPPPSAGTLNWIFGVLGIVIGLASFVWPLVCLTVLVSLALSAVGASRYNRLRHRGATGRGTAVIGIVIGLASAANLVFGISQMLDMGSQIGKLLP